MRVVRNFRARIPKCDFWLVSKRASGKQSCSSCRPPGLASESGPHQDARTGLLLGHSKVVRSRVAANGSTRQYELVEHSAIWRGEWLALRRLTVACAATPSSLN